MGAEIDAVAKAAIHGWRCAERGDPPDTVLKEGSQARRYFDAGHAWFFELEGYTKRAARGCCPGCPAELGCLERGACVVDGHSVPTDPE